MHDEPQRGELVVGEYRTQPRPGRPAFLAPPIIGTVEAVYPRRREAYVSFPGIGLRIVGLPELERATEAIGRLDAASQSWEVRNG